LDTINPLSSLGTAFRNVWPTRPVSQPQPAFDPSAPFPYANISDRRLHILRHNSDDFTEVSFNNVRLDYRGSSGEARAAESSGEASGQALGEALEQVSKAVDASALLFV
jgi:hypothetical protein